MTKRRRKPPRQTDPDENGVDATTLLATVRARIGERDLDGAERLLRAIIGPAPPNPEAFNLLGVVHELRREPLEAEKHYRAALLFGNYPPARRNLERVVIESVHGEIDLGAGEESASAQEGPASPGEGDTDD